MTVCKTPAATSRSEPNTYDPSLPWVGRRPAAGSQTGRAATPAQAGHAQELCDDADRDRRRRRIPSARGFHAGDIPNNQTLARQRARRTRARRCSRTAMNVGGRGGHAGGARSAGGRRLDVSVAGRPGPAPAVAQRGDDPVHAPAPDRRRTGRWSRSCGSAARAACSTTPSSRAATIGAVRHQVQHRRDPARPGQPRRRRGRRSRAAATARADAVDRGLSAPAQGSDFSNIPTVPVAHFRSAGPPSSPFSIGAGTPLRAATGDPVESLGAADGASAQPSRRSRRRSSACSDARTRSTTPSAEHPADADRRRRRARHQRRLRHATTSTSTTPWLPHLGSTRYAKARRHARADRRRTRPAARTIRSTCTGSRCSRSTLDQRRRAPTYVWPYHEFRDNVDVPPGYTLKFRIKLDDRALADGSTAGRRLGRWVFHCHIFFHATIGMSRSSSS